MFSGYTSKPFQKKLEGRETTYLFPNLNHFKSQPKDALVFIEPAVEAFFKDSQNKEAYERFSHQIETAAQDPEALRTLLDPLVQGLKKAYGIEHPIKTVVMEKGPSFCYAAYSAREQSLRIFYKPVLELTESLKERGASQEVIQRILCATFQEYLFHETYHAKHFDVTEQWDPKALASGNALETAQEYELNTIFYMPSTYAIPIIGVGPYQRQPLESHADQATEVFRERLKKEGWDPSPVAIQK
jgi:hypothetical protein